MEAAEPLARGGLCSFVCSVFGGCREWSPPGISTPNDSENVEQDAHYPDHSVHLSALGLHNGRVHVDHQFAPI